MYSNNKRRTKNINKRHLIILNIKDRNVER